MKDEMRSQEELSVAAVGYIPMMWLFLLLFQRWRRNYYTRYHLLHAAMINLSLLLLLLLIGGFTYFSSRWTGYSFLLTLLTGSVIGLGLLLAAVAVFYCAINAYRGRYTVLWGITRLYYLVFSQRAMPNNPYDSRRITHLRPYLRPEKEER